MRDRRRFRRLLLKISLPTLAALALLVGLGSLTAARPALAQGDDEAWVPVTIVFSSDVKGHIEPCG